MLWEVIERSVLESIQRSAENEIISVINSVNNNEHKVIQLPDKLLDIETKFILLKKQNIKLKEIFRN